MNHNKAIIVRGSIDSYRNIVATSHASSYGTGGHRICGNMTFRSFSTVSISPPTEAGKNFASIIPVSIPDAALMQSMFLGLYKTFYYRPGRLGDLGLIKIRPKFE